MATCRASAERVGSQPRFDDMGKKWFSFTDVHYGVPIGDKKASSVDDLARGAEAAWKSNMDTFSGPGSGEITRVTESKSGRVVGWINNWTGKFTKR